MIVEVGGTGVLVAVWGISGREEQNVVISAAVINKIKVRTGILDRRLIRRSRPQGIRTYQD